MTVKVNGVEVTPVSLDPTTGAVTLAVAPPVDSSVSISYYFNSFRDNFDYIPSRDVTSVSRISLVPKVVVQTLALLRVLVGFSKTIRFIGVLLLRLQQEISKRVLLVLDLLRLRLLLEMSVYF